MKKIKPFLKVIISFVAILVPYFVWKNLEILAQRAQGKGWGAKSIKQEVEVICELAKRAGILQIVALDAGANSGAWSLELASKNPAARIFSIEPSKFAYDDLAKNISIFSNITSLNFALGEKNEKRKIYFESPGSEQASLAKRRLDHFGTRWTNSETVQVVTIDWLVEASIIEAPNIVKLDIEGYELSALRGAVEAFNQIKIVQFEFGGTCIDTKVYFQDFWYFFLEADFTLFRFGPKGLLKMKKYSELDESFSVTNFFAVKN